MKTLHEYLTESKKTYSFKIKVAGPLAEDFENKVKSRLQKYGCSKCDKVTTTPIQATALEFVNLSNVEVTIFEADCSYPVTPDQILNLIKETTGTPESHLRVRNANDPFEKDNPVMVEEGDKKEPAAEKIKHKDYFGNDFNTSFLKDLDKSSKDRKKENGQGDYKLPKAKEDKAGTKSAIGS